MSNSAIADSQTKRETGSARGTFPTRRANEGDVVVSERLTVNNFDLMRLVFASMVLFFHMGVLTQAAELAWLQRWVSASFGLQGFFVVSGFLVTMSYDKSRNLLSYAQKRARRIAPAYVMVVLGAAFMLVMLTTLPWASYFSDPQWRSYVFWNLLLANFISPDLPGVFEGNYKQAVNGSLWTIKVEVAFYCMVPVVAWLNRRIGVWKLMAALFVAALCWRIGFEILSRMTGSFLWSKLAIQAPGQFSFFIIGAIAYHRTRVGLPPPPLWMALVGVVAYAVTDDLLHELVAPLAVGVVVYWAAISAPYLGRASRYGDFSYGIYLYHWPVIQAFVALGFFAYSPMLSAIGVCVTVLGLAVCSWFLLERRFLSQRRLARVATDKSEPPTTKGKPT